MKKWYFWGRRRVSCVWRRFLGIYIPRVDFGPEISCPTKLAGRQVGCASKLASRQLLTAFFSWIAGGYTCVKNTLSQVFGAVAGDNFVLL